MAPKICEGFVDDAGLQQPCIFNVSRMRRPALAKNGNTCVICGPANMQLACVTARGQGNLAYHLSRMENDVYNTALNRVPAEVRDAVRCKAEARKADVDVAGWENCIAAAPESLSMWREAAVAKAGSKRKQTGAEILCIAIANASGLSLTDVKRLLGALRNIAVKSLRKNNVFELSDLVLFIRRQTPPRMAVMRKMLGTKIGVWPAKPAGQKIKATATKQLRDAVQFAVESQAT